MIQIELKYTNDDDYNTMIEALKSIGKIKKISPPEKRDKWYKVWVKLHLNYKG